MFDFRITQSVCIQALEIYTALVNKLIEEQDNQETNVNLTTQEWTGEAADTFSMGVTSFLQHGQFASAMAQAKAMKELWESALPEINSLLIRSEGFIDQLDSSGYVEPSKTNEYNIGIINGGVLSLNYALVPVIVSLCSQISEEIMQFENQTIEIMESCNDLVDGVNDCTRSIKEVCEGAQKINNFIDSLSIYEQGIKTLEEELNLGLKRIALMSSRNSMIENSINPPIQEILINNINEMEYSHAKELGFDENMLKALKACVVTEVDRKFIDFLLNGQYEEAFLIDPTGISEVTRFALTSYANSLLYLEDGESKLTDFINAMIQTTPSRCPYTGNDFRKHYTSILAAYSEQNMQLQQLNLWSTDLSTEELRNGAKELIKSDTEMYGIWTMLKEGMKTEYFTEWDGYIFGDLTFVVEDLKRNTPIGDDMDAALTFNLSLKAWNEYGKLEDTYGRNQDGDVVRQYKPISIQMNWDIYTMIETIQAEKYQQLHYQEDLLETEFTYNMILNFLGDSTIPIDLMAGVLNCDLEMIGSAIEDLSDGVPVVNVAGSIASTLMEFRKKQQDLVKEWQNTDETTILLLMGSMVSGHIGSDVFVINGGVYDPDIVHKIEKWEEQGLTGITDKSMEEIKEIEKRIKYKDEDTTFFDNLVEEEQRETVREYLDILLYGEGDISIIDMDSEAFNKCMQLIATYGSVNCIEHLRDEDGEK